MFFQILVINDVSSSASAMVAWVMLNFIGYGRGIDGL